MERFLNQLSQEQQDLISPATGECGISVNKGSFVHFFRPYNQKTNFRQTAFDRPINSRKRDRLYEFFRKVGPPPPERRRLAKAFRHLTAEEQVILRLKERGMSVREIAEQVGSSRSGVQDAVQALRIKCNELGLRWATEILKSRRRSR